MVFSAPTHLFPVFLQGLNQSVENAGVAFVKGAYERNDYIEKNKQ